MGQKSASDTSLILDGYSGFEVSLVKGNDGHYKVVKKSRSNDKNERLRHQHTKHLFFEKMPDLGFGVPKVIGSGEKNGLFYYEYEFVEGATLVTHIDRASQEETTRICDSLLRIVRSFSSQKDSYYEKWMQGGMQDFLRQKIEVNCAKCGIDTGIKKRLLESVAAMPEKGKSLCHGDFSFDNIVLDEGGKFWLIDYQDVFPNYWMDISKLFQDIDGRWYEVKHGARLPMNKMYFMREYLLEGIRKIDPEYEKFHNALLAIVFLRILPYSKTGADHKVILERINNFVHAIK